MRENDVGSPHGGKRGKGRLGKGLARRVRAAAMAALLVVSQVLSVLSYAPQAALAAQESMTITGEGSFQDRYGLTGYRNLHWFESTGSEGGVVYCAAKAMDTPVAGTTFTASSTASRQIDWVMYHGFGGADPQNPDGISEAYFRLATQYAVWCLMPDSAQNPHYGTYGDGYKGAYAELEGSYAAVKKQAYWMIDQANAYAEVGGGPERDCALLWTSPDGVVQDVVTRTNPVGGIRLAKSSADATITDGSSCYSLEGAVYGIYSDEACTSEVASVTTDANGKAEHWGLAVGDYWVHEKVAPKGYAASDAVTRVSVGSGAWVELSVSDVPLNDPLKFRVQKVDADGNASAGYDAQGQSTLAGAQFTVKFYDGHYDSVDNLPDVATRTWVLETKMVGNHAIAILGDQYKISGDPLYKNGAVATIPLGTFTVQETKAPEGYEISDSSVHLGQVIEDDNSTTGAAIKKIGDWTPKFDQIDNGAGLAVEDQVIRGGVSVQKIDHDLSEGTAQGDATLAGAVISVSNASDAAVYVDGVRYEPGQEVTTITTDANGEGATAADALPYGTYRLTEKSAPKGYELNATWAATVSVQQDGVVVEAPSRLPDDVTRGGGSVVKADAETGSSTAQGDATLAGAEISIYNRSKAAVVVDGVLYQPGDVVAKISTGDDATAATTSATLPFGTYEARETNAPEGYLVNGDWSQTFEVSQDGQVVELEGLPEHVMRGGASVRKADLDWGTSDAQGDATLAGAEYTVYNRSKAAVMVDGKAYQPGEAVATLVTDEAGRASTADDLLPYGTYEVRETKAPEGYNVSSEWAQTFEVRSDGSMADLSTEEAATYDDVIRGGVSLRKVDTELLAAGSEDSSRPLGSATLAGAELTVYNRSKAAVVVDGKTYQPGDAVATLLTDEAGRASTAADALPYGTYEVRETRAPEGYLLNEDWSRTFEVRQDGAVTDLTSDADAVADQVKRGDISLQKHDEDSQERMAGVPFKLTSRTTGEWHVLVTDENGMADTSSSWNSHEGNTNANDAAVLADGTVDDSKLDLAAGMWFSGRTDAQTAPDDSLGALPFDVYDVQELRCAANEGHRLVSTSVTVTRHGVNLDLGTFDDKEVTVATTLTRAGSDSKSVPAASDVKLTDEVRFEGLEAGHEYGLASELHAVSQDGTDEGVVAEASATFTPQDSSDTQEVTFTVDTTGLAGKTLVAFERLYDGESLLAEHADLTDEGQTVLVPSIGTTLLSDSTSDHDAPSWADSGVTDTVRLTNLVVGEEYSVKGELRVRAADGTDAGAAASTTGQGAKAETTFKATERDMSVQLGFDVDASELAGKTVVAYETLASGDVELASHRDIADEAQSVHLPSVGTTAVSDATGDHQATQGRQTVTDTVELKNLIVGREYTVRGSLHLTGDDGAEKDALATAETTFTAEEADTTVSLTFDVDASKLGERDIVAFEQLYRDEILLAKHADPKDEGQTVHVPEVRTTATSDATGDHNVPSKGEQVVTDEVVATNLVAGKTYTVSGELHVREVAEDGTSRDAGALLDEGGNPVTAEATFTAEDSTQTVTLEFRFDASLLAGKTLVAFEELSSEGITLVVHADIDDQDQTVWAPSVGTRAASASTGEGDLPAAPGQRVTDTVSLDNLVPGDEYTLRGEVHLRGASEDGSVTDEGAVSKAEKTFTAESASMELTLEFDVDASELQGRSVTCFEGLWKKDVLVAEHSDITDEGQTVRVPAVRTTATSDATGTHEAPAAEQTTITDVVKLGNLVVGKAYVVTGTLHVKSLDEDGDAVDEGAMLDSEGNPLTATASFVADSESAEVELSFTVDTRDVAGKDVVAFEELSSKGVTLATHADIEDQDQTVRVPKVSTTLVEKDKGTHETQLADGQETVTLVDTISYENLTPGEEYELKGALRLKGTAEDGSAAEEGPAKGADGQDASATATFVPEEASGTAEVTFEASAADLTGTSLVAYEQLWHDDVMVASHEDISDGEQTVGFVDIRTTATDKADGDHEVLAAPRAEVVDEVAYEGLTPGATYELVGEMHLRDDDGSDAGVLTGPDGNPVMATTTLVTESSSGTAEVTFSFDATGLEGSTAVAFEELRRDGATVAAHADISDEAQSVSFAKPAEEYPNMGQGPEAAAAIALGLTGAAAAAALAIRHRREQ